MGQLIVEYWHIIIALVGGIAWVHAKVVKRTTFDTSIKILVKQVQDSHNEKTSAIESKINGLVETVNKRTGKVEQVLNELTSIQTDMKWLHKDYRDIKTRIGKVEDEVKSISIKIGK